MKIKTKFDRVPTSITLNIEVRQKIARYCNRESIPLSAIVEQALIEYLEKRGIRILFKPDCGFNEDQEIGEDI